jgi:hypothetical protein
MIEEAAFEVNTSVLTVSPTPSDTWSVGAAQLASSVIDYILGPLTRLIARGAVDA